MFLKKIVSHLSPATYWCVISRRFKDPKLNSWFKSWLSSQRSWWKKEAQAGGQWWCSRRWTVSNVAMVRTRPPCTLRGWIWGCWLSGREEFCIRSQSVFINCHWLGRMEVKVATAMLPAGFSGSNLINRPRLDQLSAFLLGFLRC